MKSAYFLLACVAVASAAPLPTSSKEPKLPFCDDLATKSSVKQVGITRGGASVSSSTSTQGSTSMLCVVRTPNLKKVIKAVGKSDASGNGASTGDGLFTQGVKAITEIKNTDGGLSVGTGSKGFSTTGGTAATNQGADAGGGVSVKLLEAALLEGKDGVAAIKKLVQGTATSSSGHKGSSSGDGELKVLNEGVTDLLFDKLTTPRPAKHP